jgi:hypothetical protein
LGVILDACKSEQGAQRPFADQNVPSPLEPRRDFPRPSWHPIISKDAPMPNGVATFMLGERAERMMFGGNPQ